MIALEAVAAPKMNDTQELIVTLTDASGAPVEGADVYLDLDMPASRWARTAPLPPRASMAPIAPRPPSP